LAEPEKGNWLKAQSRYGTIEETVVDESSSEAKVNAKRRWRLVRNAMRFSNAAKKSRLSWYSLGDVSPQHRDKLQKAASRILNLEEIAPQNGASP